MISYHSKTATIFAILFISTASILACGSIAAPQGIPPEQATIWALNTEVSLQKLYSNLTATAIANQSNLNTTAKTNTPESSLARNTQALEAIIATVASRNVKMREGPDLRFSAVMDLSIGTTCTIIGRYGNGWFLVVTGNGTKGWLFIDWLSMPVAYDLNAIPIIPKSELPSSCTKYCD